MATNPAVTPISDSLPAPSWPLYLAATVPLLLLAAALFVLDPLKYRLIQASITGSGLTAAAISAAVDLAPRWLIFGALLLVAVTVLVWQEMRTSAFTNALKRPGGMAFWVFATSLLLWFAQAYLYPGLLLGGDTGAHLVRIIHFGRGLTEGRVLFWNNNFYMGAPFLQFYPPLFFWLGGGFYALLGSPEWAPKLYLLCLHLLGAVFFFRFVRLLGVNHVAALIGTLGYAGAWAHSHLILYQGVLPQALTMALLPALFLAAESLITGARRPGLAWLGLALASAGLMATHQPHALFAGLYLAGYVGLRAVGQPQALRLLLLAGFAGAAGVLASLFAVLPYLAEQDWVMASAGGGFFQWEWPDLDYFRRLLVWSNQHTSAASQSAAYLGLTIVILAITSLLSAVSPRRRPGLDISLILTVALLLSLGWRGGLVRDVIFTLLFVSVLAAIGVHWVLERFSWRGSLGTILLLLVLVDLGPTAIQPLARTDKAYLIVAGDYLAALQPPERVVVTSKRFSEAATSPITVDIGPGASPLQYAPVQTVSGPHNHAATPVHNFAATILMRAQRDLALSGTVSESTKSLLAMLNVGRIVNDTGHSMGFPPEVAPADEEGPLGRALRIPNATPIVFSTTLAAMSPTPDIERPLLWHESFDGWRDPRVVGANAFLDLAIAAMDYRPENRSAAALLVRQLPEADNLGADYVEPAAPAIIREYTVSPDRVSLVVVAPAAGFVQLSHPWYPTLQVLHNGKRVEALQGAFNLMVLPALSGENRYEIVPLRSNLRRATGWFSLLVLILILATPVVARRIAKRHGSDEGH